VALFANRKLLMGDCCMGLACLSDLLFHFLTCLVQLEIKNRSDMSDLPFCCYSKEIPVVHIEHQIVVLNDPWSLAEEVTSEFS
jgi:hypothetical protein